MGNKVKKESDSIRVIIFDYGTSGKDRLVQSREVPGLYVGEDECPLAPPPEWIARVALEPRPLSRIQRWIRSLATE